jgi:hypothetical protein
MIVFSLASPNESDNQGLLFLCIKGPHRVASYAPRTRHEVIQRISEAAFFLICVSVDVQGGHGRLAVPFRLGEAELDDRSVEDSPLVEKPAIQHSKLDAIIVMFVSEVDANGVG